MQQLEATQPPTHGYHALVLPLLFVSVLAGHVLAAPVSSGLRRGVVVDDPDLESRRHAVSIADVMLDEDARLPQIRLVIDAVAQAELDARQIRYRVVVDDIDAVVAAERARVRAAAGDLRGGFYNEFRDWNALRGRMQEVASDHPDMVSVSEIGTSIEDRTIEVMTIDAPGDAGVDKPAIYITGLIHAREWLAGMTTMCMAERLAKGYETDPAVKRALDEVRFFVTPILNPDGYVYTWDGDRYWRKNRRDEHGVDLNRNFSVAWGDLEGASDDPENLTYHGTAPFSEPESQAVRDFVQSHDEIKIYVDYHSHAQYILYPPAHNGAPTLPWATEHKSLASKLAGVQTDVNGAYYEAVRCIDWYPATGTTFDWAAYEAERIGLTIELPPRDDDDGFNPPPSIITPTCDENFAGLLEMARWAAAGGDPGDDDDGDDDDAGDDDDDDDDDDDVAPDDSGTGGDDTGTGNDDGADHDNDDGCGCTLGSVAGSRRAGGWTLLGLILASRFRRRRG